MGELSERILDTKGKSEDDFEKNITYISAGTLVLSLTFIEKIVSLKSATYIGALKWSWICLVGTLLINLISHQIASWFGDLAYMEVRDQHKDHEKKVRKRNAWMRGINITTIFTLILGISLLTYFATKNAYAMAYKHDNTIQPQTHEPDLSKGRTYTPATIGGGSSTQATPPQTPNTGGNSGSGATGTSQNPKQN